MLRVGEEGVGWMSSHKLHRNDYIDLAPTNPREIRDCVRVNVGSFINNENQNHEILENWLCVMLVKKLRSF